MLLRVRIFKLFENLFKVWSNRDSKKEILGINISIIINIKIETKGKMLLLFHVILVSSICSYSIFLKMALFFFNKKNKAIIIVETKVIVTIFLNLFITISIVLFFPFVLKKNLYVIIKENPTCLSTV